MLALIAAVLVGAAACIPDRVAGLGRFVFSISLAASACVVGWVASDWAGVERLGHLAHLFVTLVFTGAVVSVYHAAKAEPPVLR